MKLNSQEFADKIMELIETVASVSNRRDDALLDKLRELNDINANLNERLKKLEANDGEE